MESTLSALLPAYTCGPLPKPLLSLAAALYSQSRSKAAALKPDEEIARSYACCHIACERYVRCLPPTAALLVHRERKTETRRLKLTRHRLKQRLDLPKIEARPPCPPRVYKKLYRYLDKALLAPTAAAPRTPTFTSTTSVPCTTEARTHAHIHGSPSSAHKKRKLQDLAVPPAPRPPPPTPNAAEDGTLPPWAGAAMKHICRAAGLPSALPHVFAGVHTLLRSGSSATTPPSPPAQKRRRTTSSARDGHADAHAAPHLYTAAALPALLSAVLVVVAQRLAGGPEDGAAEGAGDGAAAGEETRADEGEGPERAAAAPGVKSEALISTAVYELVQLGHLAPTDVDAVLDAADAHLDERADAWRRMEWCTNIVHGALAATDAADADGGAAAAPSALADVRRGGLGGMKCEAVDWLSEGRRASYRAWERRMLARIAAVESG